MTRQNLMAVLLAVVAAGCSVTERAPLKPKARSGLLSHEQLRSGGPGQPDLRYVNPAARWTDYHKVMLDPVTFWDDPHERSIPVRDQQALCDVLYQVLRKQFGQRFPLVDKPAPGVMRIHVAIVDAETATPVLRSVSMVVPQARVLATLKYLATGSYPFVGSAQIEARIADADTGMVLGDWVERRRGSGSLKTAAQWQWGDAENAMSQVATEWATRVASWTAGTAKP